MNDGSAEAKRRSLAMQGRAVKSVFTALTHAPAFCISGGPMSNVELNEHKSLVWRSIETWRRWRRLTNGYRSFEGLEDDLAQGYGMLPCGILIEPDANTIISADAKDPDFFAAIFGNDDSAVADMPPDELKQARRYIIHGEG